MYCKHRKYRFIGRCEFFHRDCSKNVCKKWLDKQKERLVHLGGLKMICAFDIKGEDCSIIIDDNKTYCDKCPSRCSTLEDLEERQNLGGENIYDLRHKIQQMERFKVNLIRQMEVGK